MSTFVEDTQSAPVFLGRQSAPIICLCPTVQINRAQAYTCAGHLPKCFTAAGL